VFKNMGAWAEIRRSVLVEGASRRSVQKKFGLHWTTARKILTEPVSPGYRMVKGKAAPKFDAYVGAIEEILRADKTVHRMQRHTAKRIWTRLVS
jgi:transposase